MQVIQQGTEQNAVTRPLFGDMGVTEHGEFDQDPENQEQKDICRVLLFKYTDHRCWTVLRLVVIDFGKTNIVTIQTRNDHLFCTHLFSIAGHKFIAFV